MIAHLKAIAILALGGFWVFTFPLAVMTEGTAISDILLVLFFAPPVAIGVIVTRITYRSFVETFR